MIDTFDCPEFEQRMKALNVLLEYVGIVDGEHCYNVPVNDDIWIRVRSSIKWDGLSADTGKDSIRVWLINGNGEPLGSKISCWITRVPGWDERLRDQLRVLWGWAQAAGYCSECKIPMGVFKVRKRSSKYYGKVFCKCRECGNGWRIISD